MSSDRRGAGPVINELMSIEGMSEIVGRRG